MRIVVAVPTRAHRETQPAPARRRPLKLGHSTRLRLVAALVLLAAVFGGTTGYFVRRDMPSLRNLEEYAPPEMTRIQARDGARLAVFGTEKRILLDLDEIPGSFRDALIASEDSRFDEHAGIDIVGGLRALWTDLRHGRMAQGASTLTMQVAGNLFLDRRERTVQRKLQEAFLAMEIERRFSKEEILRTYSNHVHFGHGLYGVEAAARYYFGKSARRLSTGESATLVGVLPRPADYSPYVDMERATKRRDLVLRRMVAEGYLTAEEAARIVDEPIELRRREAEHEAAPYFTEAVRRRIQERHGSDELYRRGLLVTTTLDPRLQSVAERAVETGLRALNQRIASRRSREGLAAAQGDEVQGALIAIEPSTGEVLALVGGSDFSSSEYDRATQAKRQPGSLFKPFVFAAALSEGWTLADTLLDEPTVFLDGPRAEPYQPENFSRKYYGTITLRTALEKSVNIPTVKLLERVGYDAVIDTTRRLGVKSRLRPYPSLALGAFELTLLEVTSAYGAFANQGILMEPHLIEEVTDREGKTIERAKPAVTETVSPQVAYLMNHVLTGVVRDGTGRSAGAALQRTLAGKTGTTDNNTDAWFVGYSRDLVVGVWVGYDEPRGLGERETGARAALPIWTEFMRDALRDTPDEAFPVPQGITTATVDRHNGCRASGWAAASTRVAEAFVAGTEPTGNCAPAEAVSLPAYDVEVLAEVVETVDAPVWRGTDGRPARVVHFGQDRD
jgi:penicillin-binding protein 1A